MLDMQNELAKMVGEVHERPSLVVESVFTPDPQYLDQELDAPSSTPEPLDGRREPQFVRACDLAFEVGEQVEWLVEPWVAAGTAVLITGKPKAAGKTTFVLSLVGAVLEGQVFLGHSTRRSPVVYLSEQTSRSLGPALDRAGIVDSEDLHLLFYPDNSRLSWRAVAEDAIERCRLVGARLLVIDTLPQFAKLRGDAENSSGDVLAALEALDAARASGIAVILVQHDRKSGGEVGESGRGSSALAAWVDTVIKLERRGGNAPSAHRVLTTLSRFDETPTNLVVTLEDRVYRALGSKDDVSAHALAEQIDFILGDVDSLSGLEADQILDRLAEQLTEPPGRRSVQAALRLGVLQGRWSRRKEAKRYLYFMAPAGADSSIHAPAVNGTDEEASSPSDSIGVER